MNILHGARVLVVTAVSSERDAVISGLRNYPNLSWSVVALGVGPVCAAAGTARLVALAEAVGTPYDMVICAGIAGGFTGKIDIGDVVIASASIIADLGADSPQGFSCVETLALGRVCLFSDSALVSALGAAFPDARVGPVLTVSTATGTHTGAAAILSRHPEAIAEAMEGYGAAFAAINANVAFVEVRAISNLIGPRDRSSWRIPEALMALTRTFSLCAAAQQ